MPAIVGVAGTTSDAPPPPPPPPWPESFPPAGGSGSEKSACRGPERCWVGGGVGGRGMAAGVHAGSRPGVASGEGVEGPGSSDLPPSSLHEQGKSRRGHLPLRQLPTHPS
jgi:hypothetical protein